MLGVPRKLQEGAGDSQGAAGGMLIPVPETSLWGRRRMLQLLTWVCSIPVESSACSPELAQLITYRRREEGNTLIFLWGFF